MRTSQAHIAYQRKVSIELVQSAWISLITFGVRLYRSSSTQSKNMFKRGGIMAERGASKLISDVAYVTIHKIVVSRNSIAESGRRNGTLTVM